MRLDVRKFLFIGVEKLRDEFFKKAQEVGVIEFINPQGGKSIVQDFEAQKIIQALKILRGLVPVEQLEGQTYDKALAISEEIIELHQKLAHLHDEENLLNLEIARIDIYGDFSLEDVDFIEKKAHVKFQYFYQLQSSKENVNIPADFIFVGSDAGMDYYVAIQKEPKLYPGFIEIKIDRPVGFLKERLSIVRKDIHDVELELKDLNRFNQFLHDSLLTRMNDVNLRSAKKCAQEPVEGKLFVVEGWVPENKMSAIETLSSQFDVYVEEVMIEESDVIPTYLENKKLSKIGEDLVHIYDTPSITDHDPSLWVLGAFILFFAMIINDAGYGMVFLLGSLFIYFKYPKIKGLGRRILKLGILLSVACIIWGTLTASFFGIEVPTGSPMRALSLTDWLAEKKAEYHIKKQDGVLKEFEKEYPALTKITDPVDFLNITKPVPNAPDVLTYPVRESFSSSIMFEIALLVGTFHIILSFLRNLRRSWSGIGWILFMIGGYLYFPNMLHATSMIHFIFGIDPEVGGRVGIELIWAGIGLALVLAIIHKKLGGALEFMVLIQIFCDVLSYLRLYALGLAGMMMGTTFNEMADMVGPLFGTLILISGHTINMAMGIMGGIIHGLRLNFLEWYHYSFEGGGRMFKPLALIEK